MTPSKVTAHEFQSILDELPDQDIAVRVLKRWASIPAVAGEQQLDRKGRFLKVVDEEKSAAWDAKKHPAASESQEYLTRFSSAALSGPDFMAQVIERPAAILGDGVFSEYQLGIFAGRGGVGKTWVSLQLALSLARGEPFFGLATPAGGIRVGVVELEDHASNYQDRLRTLSGDFPVPENLRILARPFLAGAVAILDDKARAGLIHWIR
jgi:Mrp family chromosome partitioning ATPase